MTKEELKTNNKRSIQLMLEEMFKEFLIKMDEELAD